MISKSSKTKSEKILAVLSQENITPNQRLKDVCEMIATRHPDRILAYVYYGSSLRDIDNPDKMIDLYVLVDSYNKTHRNPLRALVNWVLPPLVYYLETKDKSGELIRCKYSVMTLDAFERRCGPQAFFSVTWGRFSQPCSLLFPKTDAVQSRVMKAREDAVLQMARQTAPLFSAPVSSLEFWARGYEESYRTELRPEGAEARSKEIVARYADRYEALMDILYGPAETSGKYQIQTGSKTWAEQKWFLRRVFGKPLAAMRILGSALTFDGGFEYIQNKVYNHSGVKIEATESQRRHPVLWSPLLAFKYWRAGAFR